jgi:hypothetical protein
MKSSKNNRQKTAGGEGTSLPTITFNGDRHNGHFEVRILGRTTLLPCALFRTLIDLVIARAETETGFLPENPVTIRRLRQAIDQAVKPGTGKTLIETGSGEEYRLTIPKEEILQEVAFERGFFELEGLKVITKLQADSIRSFVIRRKSSRNRAEIGKKWSRN